MDRGGAGADRYEDRKHDAGGGGPVKHLYLVSVHEQRECVIDLFENIRRCDADSVIAVYNSGSPDLFDFDLARYGAAVYPRSRPIKWARGLHALFDMFLWVCESFDFDAATLVDSDQLCLRPYYVDALPSRPKNHRWAVLSREPRVLDATCPIIPVRSAWGERGLWEPFLRRYNRRSEFVHWCFMPGSVFSAAIMMEIALTYRSEPEFKALVDGTKALAMEEVVPITAAAVLGGDVEQHPHNHNYLLFRHAFTEQAVAEALADPAAFWIHPVARNYDDPRRRQIREALR